MSADKKWPDDLKFDELVDWAAGYILTELIAGKLRSGVWYALSTTTRWRIAQDAKQAPASAPLEQVWVLLEPMDNQRAHVLGVYEDVGVAKRDLVTERENLRASGDAQYAYLSLEAYDIFRAPKSS